MRINKGQTDADGGQQEDGVTLGCPFRIEATLKGLQQAATVCVCCKSNTQGLMLLTQHIHKNNKVLVASLCTLREKKKGKEEEEARYINPTVPEVISVSTHDYACQHAHTHAHTHPVYGFIQVMTSL